MKIKILSFFILFAIPLFCQEVIDKIVAIVDNEIIMQSELEFQVGLVASQRKISLQTPGLKQQVLKTMVEDKLVYAQANLDSITVTDDEVENRINYQIQVFTQQYGSKEKVEQAYGMSIEKIKRELRDDVKKNIMVQKLQEKNFSGIEASRKEVEDFYNKYKDSIGVIPDKVKLSHIYRNPKSSNEQKKKYYDFAKTMLDSIRNGADFSVMAKRYSQDPASAVNGGDLGFVKRGIFYPEFEAAAFALNIGQISDIVETQAGYHIIQLLEKRGEAIHTRHILIKIKNDEQADLRTIEFLTDLRDSIIRKFDTFADYAKKYSEDKESSPFGGDLGTFYESQLDKNLSDIVSKLKVGEISFPRRIEYGPDNYGYHIVYLEQKTPQHVANIDTDFQELKKLADEYKKQKLYEKWIDDLKNKIYNEVRI
ncbi:MAG: peptidylprolyl isomerase [Ignavibacteriaceae bacterium]|nr:peptidylprolyl isomerase [Ignavibacteriaceae bacterium]